MGLSRIIRLLTFMVLMLAGAASASAASGWPWQTAPAITGEAQLQLNAQMLRRAGAASAPALAARISQEGHWTFINASGETFTAGSETEVKRAFDVLLPNAGARAPAFLLTGDSVFEQRTALTQLPRGAELSLGWGDEIFRLENAAIGTANRVLAHIRPNLFVALTTAADFGETLQLLRRRLERQRFRLVSLEPGGPRSIPSSPRLDQGTSKPDVDAIDPAFIASSFAALKGQTAVIVGRLDGDLLTFKPASGPERALQLSELTTAAAVADVDLLVLKSSNGQQPGGRNWLWQRVAIKGLEQALGHATFADFFSALGGANIRLVATIERSSPQRTSVDLRQLPGTTAEAVSASRLGEVLSDAVTSLVGNVVHTGAIGTFRSVDRQAEFDRRLVSFIPSIAQWGFGSMLLLGLLGLPMSLRWWNRVWPRESAADYANAFGYWAAKAVRMAVYALVFMPLSAVLAAPMAAVAVLTRIVRRAPKPQKAGT